VVFVKLGFGRWRDTLLGILNSEKLEGRMRCRGGCLDIIFVLERERLVARCSPIARVVAILTFRVSNGVTCLGACKGGQLCRSYFSVNHRLDIRLHQERSVTHI